jgi:Domain of unknown function (DUF4476)
MKFAHPKLAAICISAFLAFGAVLVIPTFGQDNPAQGKSHVISPAQAREEVDQIVKDLREARAIAAKVGDKATREKLELILGQAELRARNLSDDLAKAKPAPPPAPVPLTAADLDKLVNGLEKEAFDPGKFTYLENFGATTQMTCQQAARLLKCFTFDDHRVKGAKLLYPKLVDRQNFNDVLDTFTFDVNKAAARKSVGLK